MMDRELLLLGLLHHKDMHGYQLHEFINQSMASCTDLKKPTAYYLLDKMAAAGWITQTEEQAGNRPPRRVYTLTEEGEVAFQRLLRENLETHSPAYFTGDIGLAFLDAISPAEAHKLLSNRRETLAEHLAAVQHVPPHAGSMQLVIDHLQHHLTLELEWLDEVIHRIEEEQE
jgi:DNA-binding PadR family transcriptional regulator